ncbi:T9SS type A sorting domain-containing protein, partial [bacterium]|nr:T9SS type A sorting domain-containing protein [bacterium]
DTNYVGEDRRQRAEQILSSATTIDPHLFLFGLARDLVTTELDPNPLPFEGSFRSYPAGIIETHHTINRYYTSSASVLVGGNGAGMPPTMWQFLGQPIVSMPVPIWVNSGEVAAPLGGPDGSELCDLAIDLKSIVYTGTYTIDTYVLADILDRFEATEDQAFSLAEDRVGSGAVVVPGADELRSLQNEIADMVLEKYWEIRALYVQEKNRGLPQNSSIVVFPNPFNSTGKLHIKTDRCGIADIEIYDTSGRLVAKPAFGMQIYSGDVDIPLVLGKLHSGIYLAVLRMDGRIASSTAFALLK